MKNYRIKYKFFKNFIFYNFLKISELELQKKQ